MNNNRTTRVTVAAASALFALSALVPVPAAFATNAVKAANTGAQATASTVAAAPDATEGTSVPFGDSGYTLRYMPDGKPATFTKAMSTYNPDKTDPALERTVEWKVFSPKGQNVSEGTVVFQRKFPGEGNKFENLSALVDPYGAAGDVRLAVTITIDSKKVTATTPVLFTILPKSISLVWDSPADRKPNDGKKVTATVDPKNGFYASDVEKYGDLSIKVADGDLQTAGSHIAEASINSSYAKLRASYVINNPKLTYTVGTTTNPEPKPDPKPEPKPDPKPNPQPQPKPEDNKKPEADSNKKPSSNTDNKKTDDKKPAANNTTKKTSTPSKTTSKNKLPQTDDQTDLQAVAAVAVTGAAVVSEKLV